jgi:5-oxoprolinase (ATP-hydrolysing)
MNNITFGNKDYQYYETICGGAPAGNGFNGADAVHTHMTNSLITDPEIMESRLPVILEEFSIRENSGGKGKFSGGCGVKRVIKFNENMDVSFLTNKRVYPPHGIESGESGKPGENIVVYKNGEIYKAEYSEAVSLSAGDKIVVKTPGGGGFGCV